MYVLSAFTHSLVVGQPVMCTADECSYPGVDDANGCVANTNSSLSNNKHL